MTAIAVDQNKRKPRKPFDPISSLSRHWLKILVFSSMLFVFLFPISIIKKKPYYQVSGRLLVLPSVETLITRSEDNPITPYYSSYVQTLCERIKAQENLEKAIERLEPWLKWIFAPEGLPISTAATILGHRLNIQYANGTHFITIDLDGDKPEGLAEIINNLMEVYLEQDQIETEGKDSKRMDYLQKEKDSIERQIKELSVEYKHIAETTGTVDFREVGNIHNSPLNSIQSEYIGAYTYRVKKENELSAAIEEQKILTTLPIDADVEDFVLTSSVASQLESSVYQEIQSLRNSLNDLAEESPDRKNIEDQILQLEKSLDFSKDNLKEDIQKIMRAKRDAQIQLKIALAKSECKIALATEKEIKNKLDQILSEKIITSNKILDGQQIESKLSQLHTLLARIEDRISTLRLESKAPGRIILESQAIKPDSPSGTNQNKLLTLLFIFSFGSVTGACVFFDIMDDRVRNRKDIENGLSIQPTWPISDYRVIGNNQIPFSKVTLQDPSNIVSKSIHSLAIRLDNERRKNQAKIISFTGVDSTSGTTEVLINTAHAMSKFCKNILIVEANFLHPSFAEVLGKDNIQVGLVDLLKKNTQTNECIFSDNERGIDVLPVGHKPSPDEMGLLDYSKFLDLCIELKKSYELIMIDSAPILVNDLTEYITLHSDITSLIVQGDRSLYRNVYMTIELLIRLQVPAIATVLNWGGPKNKSRAKAIVHTILSPLQKKLNQLQSQDLKIDVSEWKSKGKDKSNERYGQRNTGINVKSCFKILKKIFKRPFPVKFFLLVGFTLTIVALCGLIFIGGKDQVENNSIVIHPTKNTGEDAVPDDKTRKPEVNDIQEKALSSVELLSLKIVFDNMQEDKQEPYFFHENEISPFSKASGAAPSSKSN